MKVVPAPYGVAARATGRIRHLCPFVDEVDDGVITVEWVTAGGTLELHALAAHFASYKDTVISHEDLADQVRANVSALNGVTGVTVRLEFHTGGLSASVVSSEPVRPSRGGGDA